MTAKTDGPLGLASNEGLGRSGRSAQTASMLAWRYAGEPTHAYRSEPADGACATCAAALALGVPLIEIETPSTANHADYFRRGARHVCVACAWLFGAGKGRPGNFLATPKRMEYLVISLESVVQDKRPWLHALRELAALPALTHVAGVMTTDVKPRLWPRVRVATVQRMGLYLHAAEYDVSEWRQFDLGACLGLIDLMMPVLCAGFAKASLHHGLLAVVSHIGKKGTMGYGRVARWTVSDAAHSVDDVLALRAVPAAYYAGREPKGILQPQRAWTPPYWYAPLWADCMVPA